MARRNPRGIGYELEHLVHDAIKAMYKQGPKALAAGSAKATLRYYKRRNKVNKKLQKKKKPSIKTEPQGNKLSEGVLYSRAPFVSKAVLAMYSPNEWVINDGRQLVTSIGVQTALALPYAHCADLTQACTKIVESGSTQNRMYLESVKETVIMSNASTFTGRVTIYDVIARRDTTTATNSIDPLTAWSSGVVAELAAGLYTDIGNTPFTSEIFNQFYKILGKPTVIDLQPGATYTHERSIFPRKMINYGLISNTNMNGIANLTCWALIVLQGQPAHDSGTKTQVTTSGCSLDIVQAHKYNFKFISDNTTNYYRSNNLVSPFTNGPEIVNEELGELQNAAGLTATAGVY